MALSLHSLSLHPKLFRSSSESQYKRQKVTKSHKNSFKIPTKHYENPLCSQKSHKNSVKIQTKCFDSATQKFLRLWNCPFFFVFSGGSLRV